MALWTFDEPETSAASRFEGWKAQAKRPHGMYKNYASACVFALSSLVVLLQGAA